eukprot:TRINITY_DN3690_c0_g1_i4.p1 TRINITY_DN3690_c0_g1~~TRINITY_DN3690_c0_g1_i4.p1  ORF type:complete len:178 (+),score=43.68 TRINITY_DN3690_c0_g1_i4:36-536(+)
MCIRDRYQRRVHGDFLAAGLIDEKVYLFQNNGAGQYDDYWKFEGNTLGVVDVKFNPQADQLAVSSLDSNVRVFNFSQKQKIAEITCSPMECWKLSFDNSGKQIITCGELGVVKYYDAVSYTHLTLPTKRIVQISVVAVSLKKKINKCKKDIRFKSKSRQITQHEQI